MPKVIENIPERLLDELELMFVEQSPEISLRALARRAGIAVGTIYNYFPDKDELLRALFEREWSRVVERTLRAIRAVQGFPARLEAMLVVIYDSAVQNMETRQSRRRLWKSLEKGRRDTTVPYPFRPEGWRWLAGAFEPVWDAVAAGHVPARYRVDFNRLTAMLVSTVPHLLMCCPDEREQNLTFLRNALYGVMTDETR